MRDVIFSRSFFASGKVAQVWKPALLWSGCAGLRRPRPTFNEIQVPRSEEVFALVCASFLCLVRQSYEQNRTIIRRPGRSSGWHGQRVGGKISVRQSVVQGGDLGLGHGFASVCFTGPEAELTKTENAQPGIFLVSWVAFQLLKEHVPSLAFEVTAGLSLGEFTALAAADALSFEDGLKLVRQRGRFMQEACEATRGGMAAIIGLDKAPPREVCAQAGVVLANFASGRFVQ